METKLDIRVFIKRNRAMVQIRKVVLDKGHPLISSEFLSTTGGWVPLLSGCMIPEECCFDTRIAIEEGEDDYRTVQDNEEVITRRASVAPEFFEKVLDNYTLVK